MIETLLTEEQKMFRETIRRFSERELAPHMDEWEALQRVPREAFKRMGEVGIMGLTIPVEYGGSGGKTLEVVIVMEESSRVAGGVPLTHIGASSRCISHFGTDEQKLRYLPFMASGEMLSAYAQTEPDGGSDVASMKTRADLKDGFFTLNGSKCFISNASIADIFIVIAKTDVRRGREGIAAFVVKREAPGITIGKNEARMGGAASPLNTILFEDCRVPVENLVVREGEAFRALMNAFNAERCGNSAKCVGIAQGAYERALRYTQEREAFGRTISEFQGIQWMLADMATQIAAARLLVYDAAYKADQGHRIAKAAAMCKVFANEMAQKVVNDAMQLHGGYGYMRDYVVERMYREVRGMAFGGGTPQVLRNRIAYEILRGR